MSPLLVSRITRGLFDERLSSWMHYNGYKKISREKQTILARQLRGHEYEGYYIVTIQSTDDLLTMSAPATYRIIVHGGIDPAWINRLGGMSISERRSDQGDLESILVGRLSDQAALSSVLNTLYEMHLPVVSADCLEKG